MHFSAGTGTIRVLTVWISVAGVAITAAISALAGLFTPWLLIGSAIMGGVTVFAALWYPHRYASVLQGDFDGISIRSTTGVFRKRSLFVPVKALRTFEICSTPLHRIFGCRTVILRFAGGAAYLPLLPTEQAEAFTAALILLSNKDDEY